MFNHHIPVQLLIQPLFANISMIQLITLKRNANVGSMAQQDIAPIQAKLNLIDTFNTKLKF